MRHYDYIIAGSGLAGLYTAYHAAAYGKVALLTKSGITESNSYFAQGGIAAVTDEDDAPALHFEDTIIAGRGLCDYPAVDILVTAASPWGWKADITGKEFFMPAVTRQDVW